MLKYQAPRDEWAKNWPGTILSARLEEHALESPDREAVVDPAADVTLTFRELSEMAARLAGNLLSLGLGPGQVVAVQLPNCWQYVVISCAAARLNCVLCPLSMAYRDAELIHMLGASQAKVLVVHGEQSKEDYVAMAARAIIRRPSVRTLVVVGDAQAAPPEIGGTAGGVRFEDLLASTAAPTFPDISSRSPALLLFTSGTEAAPKGIVHTHDTANYSLAICSDLWGVDADDRVLVGAPMGHAAGFNFGHRLALYAGCTQVVLDGWSGAAAYNTIRDQRCSFTFAPTRFLQDVLHAAEFDTGPRPRLRVFAAGGAPIPRTLISDARDRLSCQVLATYGQTECMVATTTTPMDSAEKIGGTDGSPISGAQVRVVDSSGGELPPGELGECVTRGPHVAGGYVEETAPEQRSFRVDGWLWTGDRCTMDDDGYIRVVGRTRELIIRNGLNISPAEVENHLMGLPDVRQVAVVGYPDPTVGERACAFVVSGGRQVDLAEVTSFLDAKRVAKYKWPETVVTVDSLPYSATGKLQRKQLTSHAKRLLARPASQLRSSNIQ